MVTLNIHHVQAKITAYLDLEDYLQTQTTDGQGIIKLETLKKNHQLPARKRGQMAQQGHHHTV